MTHEELLAKLKPTDTPFPRYSPNSVVNALVAVVELHKPAFWNGRDTDIKEAYCAGCDDRCGCWEGDIMNNNKWETCPTIQAIEKELK